MRTSLKVPQYLLLVGLAAGTVVAPSCENLPTAPAQASPSAIRGFTLSAWSRDAYASAESDLAVARLQSIGASHLMLLVTAYQETPRASVVELDSMLTPSRASLDSAVHEARSRNLGVAIKVHVDVRDGSWRAAIDPVDATMWFDSYRAFILPLAEFAEAAGAVQFAFGTELAGTLDHESEWRQTIALVRDRFSGTITYASSWDEANLVPFWDAVDQIGIDAYFPITQRADAGRLEILAGWQIWLDRMEQLHKKSGRPILITEIGYRSVDGAGMTPYEFRAEGALDVGEQADLYWGATEALGSASWIAGLYWWNVRPGGPMDDRNTEYSPLGKPAEEELRRSWSGR